jgi:hypothetical protein
MCRRRKLLPTSFRVSFADRGAIWAVASMEVRQAAPLLQHSTVRRRKIPAPYELICRIGRRATVTQADIARIIRAAKQAGARSLSSFHSSTRSPFARYIVDCNIAIGSPYRVEVGAARQRRRDGSPFLVRRGSAHDWPLRSGDESRFGSHAQHAPGNERLGRGGRRFDIHADIHAKSVFRAAPIATTQRNSLIRCPCNRDSD